jgi:hypothetical protein
MANTMNSVTLSSIKEDTINKVNIVPYLHIKSMMPKEEMITNRVSVLKVEENIAANVVKKDNLKGSFLRESLNFNGSFNNNMNIQKTSSNNSNHNNHNEFDEFLLLDENLGGLEYYRYLEKTVKIFSL